MSEPLRYIIIGAAGQAAPWYRNVLPRLKELGLANPVAAVDSNPDYLAHAQQAFGLSPDHCFTHAAAAIETRKANFAILAVGPPHREKLIELCLMQDLHILSQAPLAESMVAACRIYKKVKDAGRKMAMALPARMDREKFAVEKLIRSDQFGRLNYLACRCTQNIRRPGAALAITPKTPLHESLLPDGADQHLDMLRNLAGGEAKYVYASSWTAPWSTHRGGTNASVSIEMANGIHCIHETSSSAGSTMNPPGQEYLRAELEKGTLELDRRQLNLITGGTAEAPRRQEIPIEDRPLWGNLWIAEIFCQWLRGGGPPPPTLLADHIHSASLYFAAEESAKTGKVINVPDYLKSQYAVAKGAAA
jgi:predicted dehydrogenase